MTLEQKIFKRLTETFFAKFKVKNINIGHCRVTIEDSEERYFHMDVLIRERARLIITVEPENYAADLIEAMNESSDQKRQNFCYIWDNLKDKLKVKINNIERSKDEILKNDFKWKNFTFRLSIPLYNDSINQEDTAAEYSCTMISLVLSLVDYSLIGENEGYVTVSEELHKKRERSKTNRQICIQLKGYNCSVCGMNFRKIYGNIGEHFIEVHHSTPIHSMQAGDEVDIKNDLYPVCSNCHSMIHRRNPPYTIAELKDIIEKQKQIVSIESAYKKDNNVIEQYSNVADSIDTDIPIDSAAEYKECLNSEAVANEMFLIGCYKDKEHLAWIKGNGLTGIYAPMQYNIRLGNQPGAFAKSNKIIRSASYLILYDIEDENKNFIYKIISHKLMTGDEMIEQGYSKEAHNKEYFVYKLGHEVHIDGLNLPLTLGRLRLDTKHPYIDGMPVFMIGRELFT